MKRVCRGVRAVRLALGDVGYRCVDSAHIYANERDVGRAVRLCGLAREAVYVQTKLWRSHVGDDPRTGRPRARQALPRQLKALGLEYVDLWLLHWPGPGRYLAKPPVVNAASAGAGAGAAGAAAARATELRGGALLPTKVLSRHAGVFVPPDWTPRMRLETWEHMAGDVRAGRARALGICNATAAQLRALLRHCAARALPRPAVLQQEFHPLLQQREVRALCRAEGIAFQAAAPLGAGLLRLESLPAVVAAAAAHGAPPAQVLLAWALARADSVVVKATSARHVRENGAALQLRLRGAELAAIDKCEEEVAGVAGRQERHTMATWLRERDPGCY
eukprot:g3012.t1